MDTFFISHGSPTQAINEKLPARDFLKSWQERVFPERPKAVLVICGHWDTSEPAVSVVNGPNDVIYDFYGFPEPMHEVGIFSFLHLLDLVLFFLERIHEWREITYALWDCLLKLHLPTWTLGKESLLSERSQLPHKILKGNFRLTSSVIAYSALTPLPRVIPWQAPSICAKEGGLAPLCVQAVLSFVCVCKRFLVAKLPWL